MLGLSAARAYLREVRLDFGRDAVPDIGFRAEIAANSGNRGRSEADDNLGHGETPLAGYAMRRCLTSRRTSLQRGSTAGHICV